MHQRRPLPPSPAFAALVRPARRWLGGCLLAVLAFPALADDTVPAAPSLPAKAWLLIDFHSGKELASHNADTLRPPASLTKLMTSYLVFAALKAGSLKLDDRIVVSERATRAAGSRIFLRTGDEVVAEDLIKGMIVRSANDAAIALAEYLAGTEAAFVEQMNSRLREWGLSRSSFRSVTGLDRDGHQATARELTEIGRRLLADFPEYYYWFALKEFTYNGIRQYNRNALLWRDESADGIKTGHTRAAGWCLIGSSTRGDMRLIATVLGAEDDLRRTAATEALLDYGFRHFETRRLYAADVPATRVRVWMGDDGVLPLGIGRDLYLTLPRGTHAKLRARMTVGDVQYAPVAAGQRIGTLALDVDDKTLAEYPLVALKTIDRGNIVQRALDQVRLWFE